MASADSSATSADSTVDNAGHRMKTRGKIWNANPALAALTAEVDKPKSKRRSSAQVKADNEAKEQAKIDAETELQERVTKIARIELETKNQDEVSHRDLIQNISYPLVQVRKQTQNRPRGRPKGSGKKATNSASGAKGKATGRALAATSPEVPTQEPMPALDSTSKNGAESLSKDAAMEGESPGGIGQESEKTDGEYQRALTEEPEGADKDEQGETGTDNEMDVDVEKGIGSMQGDEGEGDLDPSTSHALFLFASDT